MTSITLLLLTCALLGINSAALHTRGCFNNSHPNYQVASMFLLGFCILACNLNL